MQYQTVVKTLLIYLSHTQSYFSGNSFDHWITPWHDVLCMLTVSKCASNQQLDGEVTSCLLTTESFRFGGYQNYCSIQPRIRVVYIPV